MDVNDLLTRVIKYAVEGFAVALALFFIPRKRLDMDEILTITVCAAAVILLPILRYTIIVMYFISYLIICEYALNI